MKSVNITGTDIAWVMFVVVMFGLATVELSKPSAIKEPDAVAQAYQATMKEQLLTTTPGDLAIVKSGYILVLGGGMPYAVNQNEVSVTALHWTKSEFRSIDVFARSVERVVKKSDADYGVISACVLQHKFVTKVDLNKWTCT